MFDIPKTCTNVHSIFGVKLMYVKILIIDRLWYFQINKKQNICKLCWHKLACRIMCYEIAR